MEEYKQLVLSNPYPQSVRDQARQFKVLEEFDGKEELKNIRVPTVIILGYYLII